MKFLIVGDLHLNCAHSNPGRAEQARDTAVWVVELVEKHRPDVFVHMGDLGERNQGVDHQSLSVITRLIAEVGRRLPPQRAFWLVGNHDYYTKTGEVNLMSALAPLMPEQVVVWPWKQGPEGTVFISYLTPDGFDSVRKSLFEPKDERVLFCHQPIKGSLLRHGFYDPEGIDPTTLSLQTFVGHYHTPSPPEWTEVVGRGQVLWYVGSPRASSFQDNAYGLKREQQLRGAWVTDIAGGRVVTEPKFIENPHTRYYLSVSIDGLDREHFPGVWLERDCVLPLDRTHVRLTIPHDGRKEAEDFFRSRGVASLSVCHRRPLSTRSGGHIPPELSPEEAVVRYVNRHKDEELCGLERKELIQVGRHLLGKTFQLPPAVKD